MPPKKPPVSTLLVNEEPSQCAITLVLFQIVLYILKITNELRFASFLDQIHLTPVAATGFGRKDDHVGE